MASSRLRAAIPALAYTAKRGHGHLSGTKPFGTSSALLTESDGEVIAAPSPSESPSSSSSSFSALPYRGFRPRLSHYEVRRICLLVRHSRWDAKLEEALSEVLSQSCLTPDGVAEVIGSLPEAKQALRFFLWIRDANPQLLGHAPSTVLSRRWSHERRFPEFLNSVDLLRASSPDSSSPARSAEAFQGLALGFFWAGMADRAVQTLSLMMEENPGFRPSPQDFAFLITHLADAKLPALSWDTYQKMLLSGFCPDKKTLSSIIQCLLPDTAHAANAYEIFQTMRNAKTPVDASVFTALVQALCKSGKPTEALEVLSEMGNAGLAVDPVFHNSLLKSIAMELIRAMRVEEAYQIVYGIHEKGSSAGLVLLDALFHSLCESQKLEEAVRLWQSIAKGSTPVGSFLPRLLAELCQAGKFLESHRILQDLQGSHSSVDIHLYQTLFKGLVSSGHGQEAEDLLSGLIGEGSITKFQDLVLDLLLQNETSFCHTAFCSFIQRFCDVGNLAASRTLLNHVRKSGFQPDFASTSSLISAFCRHDRAEEGRDILLQILKDEESCCKPDIASYDLIIDGLVKLKAKKELELKLEIECQSASIAVCNG